MTDCQLERGNTATPFEHRSFANELFRCERYFQVHSNIYLKTYVGAGYTRFETYLPLNPEMRATPSRVVSNTGTSSNIRSSATSYSGLGLAMSSKAVALHMESNSAGLVSLSDRSETLSAEL